MGVLGYILKCISWHEGKRVALLGCNIHANHIKAGAVITHSGATSAAKEIQQARLFHDLTSTTSASTPSLRCQRATLSAPA
jgi:hypothetical protein